MLVLVLGLTFAAPAEAISCRIVLRQFSMRMRLTDALNASFAKIHPPFVMEGNRAFIKPLVEDLYYDLKLVRANQRRKIFKFINNIEFSESTSGQDAYVKFDGDGTPRLVVNASYQYSIYFLVLFRREFNYLIRHYAESTFYGHNANVLSRHFMEIIRSSDVKSYREDIMALLVQSDFMKRIFDSQARFIIENETTRLEKLRASLIESMAYERASKDHDIKADEIAADQMETRILGNKMFLHDLDYTNSIGLRELISIRLGQGHDQR